jgi:hypothetical protein
VFNSAFWSPSALLPFLLLQSAAVVYPMVTFHNTARPYRATALMRLFAHFLSDLCVPYFIISATFE